MKTKKFIRISLLVLVFSIGLSCTDLETPVYDKVSVFWETPEQIAAGVGLPYRGLRGLVDPLSMYSLNEVSTDEVIVPTRGIDWADGGIWETLWKHTWTPDHGNIESAWQFIYGNSDHSGIAPINLILENLDQIDPALAATVNRPLLVAQLKTVRAFYYYLGLDLFGNIPIVEHSYTPPLEIVTQTRTEVFNYVENELLGNLDPLTSNSKGDTYACPNQGFAQALLAKLYLNAEVYTGTARWANCIAACDAILQSNKYSLEPDFFYNFSIHNESSRENIYVIPFDFNAGLNIFWIELFSMHYDSNDTFGLFGAHGINGFVSTAEFLSLFDPGDVRRKMFLTGQQYLGSKQYEDQIPDPANLQYDSETGLPLFFDPDIKVFSSSDPSFSTAGARCVKWEFNPLPPMSNDFAVFRLADIILMKAEAQFRNGDAAGALVTINQKINGVSIRSRAGMPDFSSAEMNLDGLLAERARELAWEGFRRQDLIRFGHFTDARVPEKAASESFRTLFPIPKPELDKNHNLKQNPGY